MRRADQEATSSTCGVMGDQVNRVSGVPLRCVPWSSMLAPPHGALSAKKVKFDTVAEQGNDRTGGESRNRMSYFIQHMRAE